MDKEIHIVFKKNKNGSYSFYNIFVTSIGDDVQLETDNNKLSFCTGIVTRARDYILENIFDSNVEKISFNTVISKDDGHDDYYSIILDNDQLKKWIPVFQLDDEITEEGMLTFLAALFKKCDGISYINLKRDTLGKTVVSDVEFLSDRDSITLRDVSYLRNILGLTGTKFFYDDNVRIAEEISRSLDFFIHDLEDDAISNGASDIDVDKVIDEIKKRVIAQDSAVETIVNNIYTNQRVIDTGDEDFIKSAKVNILLDGPTGTGKTLILEQVARQLSIPIVVRPVTSFSTVGYKGADLTELLTLLLDKADGNLELAERGIIALDEFDKLSSRRSENSLEIKNAVQQELLSFIGGGKHLIDYKGKRVSFDTSKVTFIGFGAFTDLRERKIKENSHSSIGFSNDEKCKDRTYKVSIQDYIDEGMQKEIIGRFTLFTSTNHLTHDLLVDILNKSKLSPIKSLIQVGELYGVTIIISDEIIDKIADYALEDGTGARALQEIVNNLKNLLLGDMISSKVDRIVITEELLKKSREFMVRGY